MTISISIEQARRFLANYHFRPCDLPGVFERLGTVQYDPLNPVGRNPDLIFQARIPGYRVDDWQQAAYGERIIYDAWDKQACLVPSSDWPQRAIIRDMYRPYHDREALAGDAGTAERILAALDERGPLSSLEFEDKESKKSHADKNSWYGITHAKRLLRAMWACGIVATHHRKSGRHYFDRPERVIPAQYYEMPDLRDEEAYYRWIVGRRFQAMGLLRPTATEAAIWTACGDSATRKRAIAQLVEEGALTLVHVGEKQWVYGMPTSALPLLDAEPLAPRVTLLAPLDSLLWDRKGILQLFNFDYTWEVYKPAPQRRWGYYVLPVFYGDRFVARIDSRLENGTWTISQWWWENDVVPHAELLNGLREGAGRFLAYLQATDIQVAEGVEPQARKALLSAVPQSV